MLGLQAHSLAKNVQYATTFILNGLHFKCALKIETEKIAVLNGISSKIRVVAHSRC